MATEQSQPTTEQRQPVKPVFITPDIPLGARFEMGAWSGPVFARAIQQPTPFLVPGKLIPLPCKNCAGVGRLYVTFCSKGPAPYNYSMKQPSTWFDGNHHWGKGWYLIEKTTHYECHHCQGTGRAKHEQQEL